MLTFCASQSCKASWSTCFGIFSKTLFTATSLLIKVERLAYSKMWNLTFSYSMGVHLTLTSSQSARGIWKPFLRAWDDFSTICRRVRSGVFSWIKIFENKAFGHLTEISSSSKRNIKASQKCFKRYFFIKQCSPLCYHYML